MWQEVRSLAMMWEAQFRALTSRGASSLAPMEGAARSLAMTSREAQSPAPMEGEGRFRATALRGAQSLATMKKEARFRATSPTRPRAGLPAPRLRRPGRMWRPE